MSSSALSRVVMNAFRRHCISSTILADMQTRHVFETHQRVFELILELPVLVAAMESLISSDGAGHLHRDLKMSLAFIRDAPSTYLPVLQTWCHSLRYYNEKTFGSALTPSEIDTVDQSCDRSMNLIAKANIQLKALATWSWHGARTRGRLQKFIDHSFKANKSIRAVFHCVDELFVFLLAKVKDTTIFQEVHFRSETEPYKHLWDACLDSLDELRSLSQDWDSLHMRLYLWGSGMFDGAMALDKYLRWPETHDPDAPGFKQEIIRSIFACILYYSEIELKALLKRNDIPDELRQSILRVLPKTQAAILKEELFCPVMLSWSTDMFERVSDESAEMVNGYLTPVVIIGRTIQNLELLGNTLVRDRPFALARHEARLDELEAMGDANAMPISPTLTHNSMTGAIPLGQLEEDDEVIKIMEIVPTSVRKALTRTNDRDLPASSNSSPSKPQQQFSPARGHAPLQTIATIGTSSNDNPRNPIPAQVTHVETEGDLTEHGSSESSQGYVPGMGLRSRLKTLTPIMTRS